MDCRKTLGLGWCLLAGAVGCAHQLGPTASAPPAQTYAPPAAVQTVPSNAVVIKAADLPPKTPQAKTCTAGGDFFAREASAPGLGETERQAQQEKARRAYQQAITIDPHYLPAYLALADLYLAMKDHAHAVATYGQAAHLFPREPRVFFALGKCYGGLQKWDLAVQALGHAVELDPENRQYADSLGWMQARAGRYEDSLSTFLRIHDEAEAHYNLALMLEHMQQTDLCKDHLQAALTKDPHMEAARALLASLQAPPADPVQTAAFTETARPVLTDVTPAPVEEPAAPVNKPLPPGKRVILPPPPRIPLRYETAPAAPPTPQ